MFYVYLLASKAYGTLYVGVTSDLVKRVYEHKNKAVPGFTARYSIATLVWFEMHDSIEPAIRREKQIKEWKLPTAWSEPYDAAPTRDGKEVWAGSMLSDAVARLDPKTGSFVDYLLPRETNIRRVFVDNSTTPVTFWVGNNHGGSIVKVEPLD